MIIEINIIYIELILYLMWMFFDGGILRRFLEIKNCLLIVWLLLIYWGFVREIIVMIIFRFYGFVFI